MLSVIVRAARYRGFEPAGTSPDPQTSTDSSTDSSTQEGAS